MSTNQYDQFLSLLGVVIYVSFFSLDPLLSVLGNAFGFEIPIGLISFIIGFVLFFFIFFKKKQRLYHHAVLLSVLIFSLYINIIIIFSGGQTAGDVYIMVRYLSFFSVGYYSVMYIDKYNFSNYFIGLAYFFIITSTLYALGGREYFAGHDRINYLRVSEGIAYSGILFISISKNYFASLLMASLSGFSLWMSISRSSFFLFVFLSAFLILSNTRKKYTNIFIITLVVSYLYYMAYDLYQNVSNIHEYKIVRLIFQPSTDSSLVARVHFFVEGLEVVVDNIIFGRYGWQIERFGRFGTYIHNMLSFWAQFGVYPFLSIVFYSFYPFKVMYSRFRKMDKKSASFIFAVTFFVVANLVGAKSYRYEFALMPMGICSYVLFSASPASSTHDEGISQR